MTDKQMLDALQELSRSAGRYGRLYIALQSQSESERSKWCAQFRDCADAYEFAIRLETVV